MRPEKRSKEDDMPGIIQSVALCSSNNGRRSAVRCRFHSDSKIELAAGSGKTTILASRIEKSSDGLLHMPPISIAEGAVLHVTASRESNKSAKLSFDDFAETY